MARDRRAPVLWHKGDIYPAVPAGSSQQWSISPAGLPSRGPPWISEALLQVPRIVATSEGPTSAGLHGGHRQQGK